ncbi:adenylate kinase [SAR202 cluster bacterium AC-647-N09_OGT_505m]|nr:adenylate kinase [SAR202 cluster bacterium AC-647-N09_OGT_505m]
MVPFEPQNNHALIHQGQRIVVVGSTGSGKTTLAREISLFLDVPHVEMDALHWEANWVTAPTEVFRWRVEDALSGDAWVVDGNYSVVRDLVWPKATTLVWLDYPLRVIGWRLLRRTTRRIFTREDLWNGNRERFRNQFLTRGSLFIWLLRTYWRRKRTYPSLLKQPEHAHLVVAHLRSQRETNHWLSEVGSECKLGKMDCTLPTT